jgi:hypothetical protein
MRTVRTKVYTFEELNETAQQTAINSNSSINVNYDWWINTYSDAENIGLKITSFELDRNKNAKGHFVTDAFNCATKIISEHGAECKTFLISSEFMLKWAEIVKAHSNGKNIFKVAEGQELSFDEKADELEGIFLDDILSAYADILQDECEYLQSDEAIKETLISDECEFTKNGNIFNS